MAVCHNLYFPWPAFWLSAHVKISTVLNVKLPKFSTVAAGLYTIWTRKNVLNFAFDNRFSTLPSAQFYDSQTSNCTCKQYKQLRTVTSYSVHGMGGDNPSCAWDPSIYQCHGQSWKVDWHVLWSCCNYSAGNASTRSFPSDIWPPFFFYFLTQGTIAQ